MNINILSYLLNAITLLLYSQIWNTFFQFCDALFVIIFLPLFITSYSLHFIISDNGVDDIGYVSPSSLFYFPFWYLLFSLFPASSLLFSLISFLYISLLSLFLFLICYSEWCLSLSPPPMPHPNLLSSSPCSQFLFYFI